MNTNAIAVQLFVVELLCQDLLANHGRLLFIGGLGSPSMNNKNVNSYIARKNPNTRFLPMPFLKGAYIQ